jgi:ABC-type glycerol-3-phosphate transport system substrate-binding protein
MFKAGSNVMPDGSYIEKKIKEDTNIDYVQVPPGDNSDDTLNMMLAAGDVPDLSDSYTDRTTMLIDGDWIVPMEDYLNDQYLPNFCRVTNDFDTVKEELRRDDGHIWSLFQCNADSGESTPVPYIRYDWLKKLNLEVPTTIDELTDVLTAFATQDPDGDGKADTFGMMLFNNAYNASYYEIWFAAAAAHYYKNDDGTLVRGDHTERYVEYLKWLQTLYKNGAIPMDTMSYKDSQEATMLQGGQLGFALTYNDYKTTNDILKQTWPDADYEYMPAIKGDYNDKGYVPASYAFREENVVFKQAVDAGKLPAILALVEYMADDTSTDPENPTFEGTYWTSRYGEKGVTWDVNADGYFDQGEFKDTDPASAAIYNNINQNALWTNYGSSARVRSKFDNARTLAEPDPKVREMTLDMMNAPKYNEMDQSLPYAMIDDQMIVWPDDVVNYNTEVQNYHDQLLADVLDPDADVDALWKAYVEQCDKLGYQDVLKSATDTLTKAGRYTAPAAE